ncbi:hypothetical protein BHE74_00020339 [Ensete ventricosum]|nr:hypothetical protein BHE74_00020339 [Ensete ventricosum]
MDVQEDSAEMDQQDSNLVERRGGCARRRPYLEKVRAEGDPWSQVPKVSIQSFFFFFSFSFFFFFFFDPFFPRYSQSATICRGYFRCTHRNTVGCLAMKQVQRSDDDPSVFDITYRGEHTCPQKPRTVATSALHQPDIHQSQQRPRQDQQLLLSFQTSLKVKTEGSSFEDTDQNSPFSFRSTPMSTLSTPFSAAFTSPATSESKYFGDAPPLHMTESDLTDIIYATTSAATSSSTMDISFMLDSVGFDPAFHFDASSFLHNF